MACKFVMAHYGKNVIFVTPQFEKQKQKKEEKYYMMTWCIIPHHINLGPHISMP
jgi:hypothetical protein